MAQVEDVVAGRVMRQEPLCPSLHVFLVLLV